ncbi:MAG: fumarylacetoacetate hydrolase family protein [Gaiella sp.]
MRYIRYVDPAGAIRVAIEQPGKGTQAQVLFEEANESDLIQGLSAGFTQSFRSFAADPELLELGGALRLLPPIASPEVWCAGVTYERSRNARVGESNSKDVYERVYDAHRPELFLKDAGGRRTVGPGDPIGIRGDATWTVPEPEIGLVLGERGAIIGYTIGNDVSSRDIEGANPLYLPQAKVYKAACAIGPAVYVEKNRKQPFTVYMQISDAAGTELFSGKTSTEKMKRGFEELVEWLCRDNPVPPGSVLLTGTGLVPPDDFTLAPGHIVEIHVPEIGTLSNPVLFANEIELREKYGDRYMHHM